MYRIIALLLALSSTSAFAGSCLEEVAKEYDKEWANECDRLNKNSDCRLPLTTVVVLDNRLHKASELCVSAGAVGRSPSDTNRWVVAPPK